MGARARASAGPPSRSCASAGPGSPSREVETDLWGLRADARGRHRAADDGRAHARGHAALRLRRLRRRGGAGLRAVARADARRGREPPAHVRRADGVGPGARRRAGARRGAPTPSGCAGATRSSSSTTSGGRSHPGLTLHRVGGHFRGQAVVEWTAGADGRGVLLAGDAVFPNPDRRSVSFMRSYPNRIPLSGNVVQRIAGPARGVALRPALQQLRRRRAVGRQGRAPPVGGPSRGVDAGGLRPPDLMTAHSRRGRTPVPPCPSCSTPDPVGLRSTLNCRRR